MTKYNINGGRILKGEVCISGAKNAILPILSATIINKGTTIISNCPDISDVRKTLSILEDLGCNVNFINSGYNNIIEVDSTKIYNNKINEEKASSCRSTITFLGSLTARMHEAEVAYPGGCVIGERPVDIHESAIKQMGIETIVKDKYIQTKMKKTDFFTDYGKNVYLKIPSVGATENAMMVAAGLEETVNIFGAATEPEIVCLGNYLKKIGAKIEGLGTSHIKIQGKKNYANHKVKFSIIPDRIEAATYMIIAAATKSNIKIQNCDALHCKEIISTLQKMGITIIEHKNIKDNKEQATIEILKPSKKRLESPGVIIADAYPAFPTDAQSLMLPLLATAKGETYIIDKIFPKRFKAAEELIKAGAKIKKTHSGIKITGQKHLKGTCLISSDLRAGAAMIITGLMTKGQTEILDADYIKRGYDKITEKLRALGADITESQITPQIRSI